MGNPGRAIFEKSERKPNFGSTECKTHMSDGLIAMFSLCVMTAILPTNPSSGSASKAAVPGWPPIAIARNSKQPKPLGR